MDNALNLLCERNIGLCKYSRKIFRELIINFIIGSDKACFVENTHGGSKVISSADIKE